MVVGEIGGNFQTKKGSFRFSAQRTHGKEGKLNQGIKGRERHKKG